MKHAVFFLAIFWLAGLALPTTGNARLDACLDAGLSPEHCKAWSESQ